MAYLVAVLISISFLAGFVVLVGYERRHATRFFAVKRERFDAQIGRVEFIIANVDLGSFVRDEIQHLLTRIGHAIAHLSLQAVRAAERVLTRIVRYLRTMHDEETAPRETAREFVKTLSDFKETLNAVHPEVRVPDAE